MACRALFFILPQPAQSILYHDPIAPILAPSFVPTLETSLELLRVEHGSVTQEASQTIRFAHSCATKLDGLDDASLSRSDTT